MITMMRLAARVHCLLSAYLWLITSIPLGNWNLQRGQRLLPALLSGQGIDTGDVFTLAFISMPAVLFWIGYKRSSFWWGVAALGFDAIWLALEIQSWWIPYIFGTSRQWQLDYAKGPTTKLLPSFGNHVAPDGMHLMIHVLLITALITGVSGLRRLRRAK